MQVARPLGMRAATNPVSGIAATAPAAKQSRTTLSAPSPSAKSALSLGIAAAHAPIPRPLAKNTPRVARRSGHRRRAILPATVVAPAIVNPFSRTMKSEAEGSPLPFLAAGVKRDAPTSLRAGLTRQTSAPPPEPELALIAGSFRPADNNHEITV